MAAPAESGRSAFSSRTFFGPEALAEITDLRVRQPELAREAMARRKRRATLAPDGRLVILAADHPGRGQTRIGDQPWAMGDRADYLSRILRVLRGSGIDCFMATSDLVEDVVLADHLVRQRGGAGFLDEKVLLGSMNRGGILGTYNELLDRTTSYLHGARIRELNLDGAKVLWRWVVHGEPNDRNALDTLVHLARAMEELAELKLPCFMEPLPVVKTENGYKTELNSDHIIRAIGIASALGYYTGHVWLKIPYCDNFVRVVKSTSLPVLLLGGESTGRPKAIVEDFARGLAAGPNVRGALVGRNVLYPGDDDPAVIAEAINLVVHKRLEGTEAMAQARQERGTRAEPLLGIGS